MRQIEYDFKLNAFSYIHGHCPWGIVKFTNILPMLSRFSFIFLIKNQYYSIEMEILSTKAKSLAVMIEKWAINRILKKKDTKYWDIHEFFCWRWYALQQWTFSFICLIGHVRRKSILNPFANASIILSFVVVPSVKNKPKTDYETISISNFITFWYVQYNFHVNKNDIIYVLQLATSQCNRILLHVITWNVPSYHLPLSSSLVASIIWHQKYQVVALNCVTASYRFQVKILYLL